MSGRGMDTSDTVTSALTPQGLGEYKLQGALEFSTVPALWNQSVELFPNTKDNVTVDLKEVQRADSSGLALLVSWMRWAKANDRSMIFARVPDRIVALVDTNHLSDFLGIRA